MRMSLIMASGCVIFSRASMASPLSKLSLMNPAFSKDFSSTQRIERSSSTIQIRSLVMSHYLL